MASPCPPLDDENDRCISALTCVIVARMRGVSTRAAVAGFLASLAALAGCPSSNTPARSDLGGEAPADAGASDCEAVCFEWVEPRPRCSVPGSFNGRCPEGFECRAMALDERGECVDVAGQRESLRFEVGLPSIVGDEVPVRLRLTINGEGPANADEHFLGELQSTLLLFQPGAVMPFEAIHLAPGQNVATLRLPPGVYEVEHPLDDYQAFEDITGEVGATSGDGPPPGRVGRLRVVAAGEVTIDWDVAVADWTLSVDGAAPDGDDAILYFGRVDSPRVISSRRGERPGEGRTHVEPGSYAVTASFSRVDEVLGLRMWSRVELGVVEVLENRDLPFSVETQVAQGTVLVDEQPPTGAGLELRFVGERHEHAVAVDPETGRYRAQLPADTYSVRLAGSLANGSRVAAVVETDPSGPLGDLRFRTGQVSVELVGAGGAPLPDAFARGGSVVLAVDPGHWSPGSWFEISPGAPAMGRLVLGQAYRPILRGNARVELHEYVYSYPVVETLDASLRVDEPGALVTVEVPSTRLMISVSQDGRALPDGRFPDRDRAFLQLRGPIGSGPQLVAFPNAGGAPATAQVLPGRFDLVYVRGPREDLSGPFGAVFLETVDIDVGSTFTRSYDVSSVSLEGSLVVNGEAISAPLGTNLGVVVARESMSNVRSTAPVRADGGFSLEVFAGAYEFLRYECRQDEGCKGRDYGLSSRTLLAAFDATP